MKVTYRPGSVTWKYCLSLRRALKSGLGRHQFVNDDEANKLLDQRIESPFCSSCKV
jgi:hypothetical protein